MYIQRQLPCFGKLCKPLCRILPAYLGYTAWTSVSPWISKVIHPWLFGSKERRQIWSYQSLRLQLVESCRDDHLHLHDYCQRSEDANKAMNLSRGMVFGKKGVSRTESLVQYSFMLGLGIIPMAIIMARNTDISSCVVLNHSFMWLGVWSFGLSAAYRFVSSDMCLISSGGKKCLNISVGLLVLSKFWTWSPDAPPKPYRRGKLSVFFHCKSLSGAVAARFRGLANGTFMSELLALLSISEVCSETESKSKSEPLLAVRVSSSSLDAIVYGSDRGALPVGPQN